MSRIIAILFTILVPVINTGSDKPVSDTGSRFIDITVESNFDKEYFQYDLKQRCIPVPGIPEFMLNYVPVVKIRIPVNEFKCTNKIAYREFLNTLKASEFPWLEIDIPPYSEDRSYDGSSAILRDITIKVAGIAKNYDISCRVMEYNSDHSVLNGSAVLKLTDFGIAPPVKFMGLIKVKNEISINFELCLASFRRSSLTPISW